MLASFEQMASVAGVHFSLLSVKMVGPWGADLAHDDCWFPPAIFLLYFDGLLV